MTTCALLNQIKVTELPASIAGCEECLKIGSPWLHVRMCMSCGKRSVAATLRRARRRE